MTDRAGRRRSLGDAEYRELLQFRTGLRRFLRWSEEQASAAGLTPAQHQLLLAVRGHEDARGPAITDVAELLLLRHNSTVELVDRAERQGLVVRSTDPSDHRVTRLRLTRDGEMRLERLSAAHIEELRRLEPSVLPIWEGLKSTREGRIRRG